VARYPAKGLRLFALGGAWLLITLFATGQAEAQPVHGYAVKWSTAEHAESCLQQTELVAAVAKLVSAEQLTTTEQATRVIFGRARHDGPWRATLRVVDSSGVALGERELESNAASCAELGQAVALVIALIIDPEHVPAADRAQETGATSAAVRQSLPGPPRTPVPAAPVASTAIVLPAAVPTAPNPSVPVIDFSPPARHSVKAGAVVSSGLLPEVALGAQLEFWQPLPGMHSLRFALAYFGAQTQDVPEHARARATLYVTTARVAYCPLLAASRKVSVFGCVGVESGLMVARGQGGGYDNSPARGLLALDGGLTVDRSLAGPWALSLTAGAALTLFQPTFSYRTADEREIYVHRPGALEGRLEIGLAYQF
jgi:hypothetical protein